MSKRVLICDDANFMRKLLGGTLKRLGHEVIGEAEDGVEAVNKYKLLKPDVVFMDVTMPNKDGVEAVKDIIALDSSAKIIMCSAMGQQGIVLDSLKAGAKDFVIKPFEKDRIADAISKI